MDALLKFEQPADALLSRFFRDRPRLGVRDRAFIAESCYGVLRHLRSLEHLAGGRTTRRLLGARPLDLAGLRDGLARLPALCGQLVKAGQLLAGIAACLIAPEGIVELPVRAIPPDQRLRDSTDVGATVSSRVQAQ